MLKAQVLPPGQERLVNTMFKLSALHKDDSANHRPEFPISVRTDLQPRSVRRLESRIKDAQRDPPRVDTSVRCVR